MTWVRLPDELATAPEVVEMPLDCLGLHVRALAYSNAHGLDLRLPRKALGVLGGTPARVSRLTRSGWWQDIGQLILLVLWGDLQPTAQEVAELRVKRATAGSRGGLAKASAGKPPSTCQGTATNTALAKPCPVPSRPDPDPRAADAALPRAQQRRLPSNLEEALKLPIAERAKLCTDEPSRAEWLEPESWPEVRAVAEALAESLRQPSVLGGWRDRGVQAVVALFAAGLTPEQAVAAARTAKTDPWWQGGKRGLSSLTPEVARRALMAQPQPDVDRLRARAARDRLEAELSKREERLSAAEYVQLGSEQQRALLSGIGGGE